MAGADSKKRDSKKVEVAQSLFPDVNLQDGIMPRLKDRYIWEPFNVLNTQSGEWNKLRKPWRNLLLISGEDADNTGIKAEEIENVEAFTKFTAGKGIAKVKIAEEAVFDPLLLDILFDWYCPEGGRIFDPFNGSHVSAGVCHKRGYQYTGIDVRPQIIAQNKEKLKKIFPLFEPHYLCGNSKHVLDELIFEEPYHLFNSCPPYANLVKYSKDNPIDGDISLLDYDEFVEEYREIIKKGCYLLYPDGYACFTIGQVRDKKTGELLPFKEDTIKAFKDCGMKHWNEVQLIGSFGSAGARAKGTFERGKGKLVNVHQNVLIFKKC